MSGYLDFTPTGDKGIDRILDALRYCGDLYHHTSDWRDEDPNNLDGLSCFQYVQKIANEEAATRAPAVTDDAAVERAAKAAHRSAWPETSWSTIPESYRQHWRDCARAALQAALGDGGG